MISSIYASELQQKYTKQGLAADIRKMQVHRQLQEHMRVPPQQKNTIVCNHESQTSCNLRESNF